MRSLVADSRRWKNIEYMGSSMKSFNPVGRRHFGLKKKSTNSIVDCSYHPLTFAILLRGVRTRESNFDAMSIEMFHEL